ncbi:unnamed protein product, partial [marine sediment metagenome]
MRPCLATWISDADASRHLEYFRVSQPTLDLAHIHTRADDYYVSLVGELFDNMRQENGDAGTWARLGNALWQFATGSTETTRSLEGIGVAIDEALLFA